MTTRCLRFHAALVRQLSAELSHRGVGEALGQLGSHKTLQRQILDADPVVVADQVGRQLVQEVSPLVGDPLMDSGDFSLALAFRWLPSLRRESPRCALRSFLWPLR